MYEAHFGLQRRPFGVSPDPHVFYENAAYREAVATLVYAVQERRGFGLLTGEVGTGKTTVVRRALEELEPAARCLHFYHTMLGFEDLVRVVCDEFQVPGAEGPLVSRLTRLNDWLIGELAAGRVVALLVDEAQNLADDTLEQLRLLSNLETAQARLLQIVLIGQPELEAKLRRPHLRQLRQRVAVRCRLSPLGTADEVRRFVEFRLRAAGQTGRPLFSADAMAILTLASRGVPRLINILADNALLLAYAAGARRVTGPLVREAAVDLGLVTPAAWRPPARPPVAPVIGRPARPAPWRPLTAGTAAAAALIGAAALWPADAGGRWDSVVEGARARLAGLFPGAPLALGPETIASPPSLPAPAAGATAEGDAAGRAAPGRVADEEVGPLAAMEFLLERIRAAVGRPPQE